MADDPLTHFDGAGAARMVSISPKAESPRMARAGAVVELAAGTLARIQGGSADKGDVLGIARIAAISATKGTAAAIPLCHPVRLTSVDVQFRVAQDPCRIAIEVEVHGVDRTGPEMEAMHGASVAALTIYDMCKAMDRGMVIRDLRLLEKAGGKSGHWRSEPLV